MQYQIIKLNSDDTVEILCRFSSFIDATGYMKTLYKEHQLIYNSKLDHARPYLSNRNKDLRVYALDQMTLFKIQYVR